MAEARMRARAVAAGSSAMSCAQIEWVLYLRRNPPKDGKGAALVLPRCDNEAMNLYLAEIATQIAPGAHAACSSIRPAGISPAA